jgi:hypothetical protein
MDLLGLTLRAVDKAFAVTDQFQQDVTFQLQIVWQLDPINDVVNPQPTFTKTVRAVVYKPTLRRIDVTGGYVFTEEICCQQWTDAPAPSISDRVLIPSGYGPGAPLLRQVTEVNEDPANAIWIVSTRLPTQLN